MPKNLREAIWTGAAIIGHGLAAACMTFALLLIAAAPQLFQHPAQLVWIARILLFTWAAIWCTRHVTLPIPRALAEASRWIMPATGAFIAVAGSAEGAAVEAVVVGGAVLTAAQGSVLVARPRRWRLGLAMAMAFLGLVVLVGGCVRMGSWMPGQLWAVTILELDLAYLVVRWIRRRRGAGVVVS